MLDKYSTPKSLIYFPLALGGHVDHRILSGVGILVRKYFGKQVIFYEDFPYAAWSKKTSEEDSEYKILRPETIRVGRGKMKQKLTAIFLYQSQIDFLFKEKSKLQEKFWKFYGGREFCERYWR